MIHYILVASVQTAIILQFIIVTRRYSEIKKILESERKEFDYWKAKYRETKK